MFQISVARRRPFWTFTHDISLVLILGQYFTNGVMDKVIEYLFILLILADQVILCLIMVLIFVTLISIWCIKVPFSYCDTLNIY